MIAYVYLVRTGEVVAKIDEKSEMDFAESLRLALPTQMYDYRFETRQERRNVRYNRRLGRSMDRG